MQRVFLHPGGEGFRASVVFGLHGRKWCGCEWGCVEIMWEAYPISWCHSTSVYFSIMVLGVPTITPNINRISTQLIDWSGEKSPETDHLHTDFSKHFIVFFLGYNYHQPSMVLTFSYFAFNIQAGQVGFLYLLGWLISTTLQIHSLIWGGIVPAFRSRKLRKKRHDHCACPGFTWFHQLLWKWCYSFHLMDRGHKKTYCLWEIQRQLCMSQWLLLKAGEKKRFPFPQTNPCG